MSTCPFCSILSGQLPASFVYRDDTCAVFMDIHPVNPGHMLVIPLEHYPDLHSLPEETGQHLFSTARRTARALRNSGIQCQGVNLFLADGKAAMQEVMHLHLHVIPRFEGDGFGFQFGPLYAELPTREELEQQAFFIKQALEVGDRPAALAGGNTDG